MLSLTWRQWAGSIAYGTFTAAVANMVAVAFDVYVAGIAFLLMLACGALIARAVFT